jgi:hypothetical protein
MERKQFSPIYITVFIVFMFLLTCDYMSPASGFRSEDYDIIKNMNTDTLPLLSLDSLDTVFTIKGSSNRAFRLSVNTSKEFYIEATSSSSGCSGFSILDSTYKSVYSRGSIYPSDGTIITYISRGKYFLILKNNCSTSGNVSISLRVDFTEQDNARATARMVEVNGDSLTGTLGKYDVDMLKFTAMKDSCYKVIVKNALNYNLTLLRPDSTQLASVSSTIDPSTLSFRCTVTETYYFTITNTNYSSSNPKPSYTCSVITLPVDSYEPDDSIHQATLLPVDGTVQSHTIFSGDVDWIRCSIPQGFYYLVKVNGASYGTGIYTDKKALLASLGTNDSLFIWGVAPTDSVVYIKVGNELSNEYSSSLTLNSYTISTTAIPIDQYEPDDNNPVNARLIQVGGEAFKGAHIISDIDWIKFIVKAGSTYDVLGTGNSSFIVGIYKSSSLTYISSRSFGSHNLYTASSDDTIYLKIGERSGTSINTFRPTQTTKSPVFEYSINVNTIQNDTYEYDNTLKSAKSITTDGNIQKRIFTAGDTDAITFNAIADSSYMIVVSNAYRVRLYSDSATILRTQYNSANPSMGITLKWMCTRSGTYYFDVMNPYMGDSLVLHYTASVKTFKNDQFEPDNIMSMATLLDTSKTPPTHTLIQNDVDWFKFTVTPFINLKISSTGIDELPIFAYKSKNDTLYYSDTLPRVLFTNNFDSITEIFIRIGPLSEKTIKAHENDPLFYNYSLKLIPLYNDLYEPDRTTKTANTIELNGQAQSRVLVNYDVDHIKLNAVRDSSYKITFTNILKMSLLNASGSVIFNLTWPNSGTTNSFKWTCPESGVFYVKLDSASQDWNVEREYPRVNYTISFESARGDAYEPDNTPLTATSIKADTVKQHHSLFIMDEDWVKFTGAKETGYQFFCEQQATTPNVNMSLYGSDGKTLYQYSMVSGTKWKCPANGDYYIKFWVDAAASVNNSEWEYSTYLQNTSLTAISRDQIRNVAQPGYFFTKHSLTLPKVSSAWYTIAMENDNLYQVCVQSISPVTCALFDSALSVDMVPISAITKTIGNEIVQVFVWKPQNTATYYMAFGNTGTSDVPMSFLITPFVNDAFEPDTLLNQLHTVSTDSIPIYRTLSINDTSDAILFHGVDRKNYKLGSTSDSVTLKVNTQSATGAKLTLLETAPGQIRLSCSGTGDFIVNFRPSGFSGRVLSYTFYVKEE